MIDRSQRQADTVIVLDFETTGLSPDHGDRVIEVGALRVEQGKITGRFQRLMNPGRRVSTFIEGYTGITNDMLRNAAPCAEVMAEFCDFIGDFDLVAHNAAFDRRFLEAELKQITRCYAGTFACSMLVSRRVYPEAPGHRLGTLVEYRNIPASGTFHRALADAEMTTRLWLRMLEDIRDRHRIGNIPFALMQQLSRVSKSAAAAFLQQARAAAER